MQGKNNEMTVGAMAREIQQRLTPEYGEGEARAMTRLLFHAFKGWDATALIIHSDEAVSEYLRDKLESAMLRLMKGEPLQYILGEARFYGMDLKVNPRVLIPRPETAELVDIIVRENPGSDLRVLDVGTGSGAIAIALSRHLRFPLVTAIDISPAALEVARDNAIRLHARIDFKEEDIFKWQPPAGSFDIIVSNPPYVAESERASMERNVLSYEPPQALFVPDENPLVYYSRIAEIGMEALAENGRLYFEINPLFAEDLRQMLVAEGYKDVTLLKDSYSKTRFAIARK